MEEASLSELIGSWRLISVQFRMSDNGEVIDEPIEGVAGTRTVIFPRR